MLPKGWTRRALGEIAQITSGGTPDRTEPAYWGGHIPWVTTGEIQFNTITETEETITEAGLKNSSAKLFPPGTLLMAMYGQGKTRGQLALLGVPAATNQNSAAIIFQNEYDPEFYFQYFWSKYEALREVGQSAGISHLNAGILKQIAVPVPTLSEQRNISNALKVWDAAIVATGKLLTTSRQQTGALSSRLFSAADRLPGFTAAWTFRTIRSLTERVQRSDDGMEHPILMISSSRGWVRQDEMFSRYMAGDSAEQYVRLNRGEFAYNKGNSQTYPCGCVFQLESFESGLVPHVYVCFRFKDEINTDFYKHYFAARMLDRQLTRVINTGVRNNGLLNLRPDEFFACKVPVPPIEEQTAIANAVNASSRQTQRYKAALEALEFEKRALMQQLLTGRRRLSVPEPSRKSASGGTS